MDHLINQLDSELVSLVWLSLSDEAAGLTGEYVQDEKVLQPSGQARDEILA